MKYIYYILSGLLVLLLSGCVHAINVGTNMQDAKKAVAEGKVNETYGGINGLGYAVTKPHNSEIIIYLLENGADTGGKDCKNSAIRSAIWEEYTINQYKNKLQLLDNIEILLKYRADCKDSALFYTVAMGHNDGGNKHLPLVKMLLSYGANPNKKLNTRWGDNLSANDLMRRYARETQSESSSNNREMWGKIAAIGMGAAIASSSSLDSAAQADFMTNYSADVMNDDMSMSNTKQWKDKTVQASSKSYSNGSSSGASEVDRNKKISSRCKQKSKSYNDGDGQSTPHCQHAIYDQCVADEMCTLYPDKCKVLNARVTTSCEILSKMGDTQCPTCN